MHGRVAHLALVMVVGVACDRDSAVRAKKPEPSEVPSEVAAAPDRSEGTRSSLEGFDKPVAPFEADPERSPTVVSPETVLSLTTDGERLYGIVSGDEPDDPDRVVVVDTTSWDFEELGQVNAPATLLVVEGKLHVASKAGLELVSARAPKKLYEGQLSTAVVDGQTAYWAACPGESACSIGRTDLGTGKSETVTSVRFDVVNDVAIWKGAVWVAGRHRDPKEGLPPSKAERDATARWILSGGGTKLPAGTRYAPGYLAEIDEEGDVDYEHFPTHRPIEIERDGESLLVLTEGTPGDMFSDGLLFRIDGDEKWTVMATGLAMPDDLAVGQARVCWETMPAKRFQIQCWDRAANEARTVVSQNWNLLGFVDDGTHLTFTVLTKGIHRVAVP